MKKECETWKGFLINPVQASVQINTDLSVFLNSHLVFFNFSWFREHQWICSTTFHCVNWEKYTKNTKRWFTWFIWNSEMLSRLISTYYCSLWRCYVVYHSCHNPSPSPSPKSNFKFWIPKSKVSILCFFSPWSLNSSRVVNCTPQLSQTLNYIMYWQTFIVVTEW